MFTRLVLPCLIALLLASGFARAAEVAGQDSPRFRAALGLWLEDDEATALPDLAALAAEGNRAAQILLALIDTTPSLQGPWLLTLPRADRNALLRAPGGLSGQGWMQAAAEDTELAVLWRDQSMPGAATGDTALAFAALGEARAARATLEALIRRQYRGFAALADDPAYPADMRYLIWLEWAEAPGDREKAEAEIAAAHPGDPQVSRFEFRAIEPAALEDWLARAPLAEPLRAACAVTCPDSAPACVRAGFDLLGFPAGLGGAHAGLALFGTPSETLIPPEVWNASPRARATLLRRPDARHPREAQAALERTNEFSTCLGDALAAETARFAR